MVLSVGDGSYFYITGQTVQYYKTMSDLLNDHGPVSHIVFPRSK